MNQQQYRTSWLRSHKTYEKKAYTILKRTFKAMGNDIPFDELTTTNYASKINLSIKEDKLTDAYIQIYLQIGLIHGNRVGKGINKELKEFDPGVFGENLRRYIYVWMKDNLGFRIMSVRETYIKYIIDILENRLKEGKTILEASKEIAKLINQRNFFSWQALRIARTETTTAANLGAIQAGKSAGILQEKIWISATDARVRRHPKSTFDHLEMNGKTVLESEYFEVPNINGGFERIEFPGAQLTQHGNLSSAGNIINCRCTVGIRAKRDRNGRIIRTR